MKFHLFFLLLALFSLEETLAEAPKYALIRKIQGTELLPPAITRQLQSSTLKVITQKSDYELLLSGSDTPMGSVIKVVALESEVSKEGDRYRIEVRLLDLKNQRLINKAGKGEIREEDLIRLFEGALESLFIKDPKTKEETPKNEVKSVKSPKTPLPSTLQVTPAKASSIDFKERIRSLQADADKAIQDEVEKEAKIYQEKKTKSTPSAQSLTAAKSPVINRSEQVMPEEESFPTKIYPRNYQISAEYEAREIKSNYYIGTLTKAQFVNLSGLARFPFPIWEGKFKASTELSYSRVITSEVVPPTVYQLEGTLGWFESNWHITGGLVQDASFFVTLPTPGEGLAPESLTTVWTRAEGNYSSELWGKPWSIGMSYAIPMSTQTSFKPLKGVKNWNGTLSAVKIIPPFKMKEWKTQLNIERINLHAEGDRLFTFNESRFALAVWRSL